MAYGEFTSNDPRIDGALRKTFDNRFYGDGDDKVTFMRTLPEAGAAEVIP